MSALSSSLSERRFSLLVFVFALLVRFAYLAEISGTPVWEWHELLETDTGTYLRVAEQIREGDLLVHRPYHPFHSWMAELGSREEWARWWNPAVFHQAPGYYYVLAAWLTLLSGSLAGVRIIQAVLGALHVVLLARVALSLSGRAMAVAVGVLGALYGPFVVSETMVLREGVGMLAETAGVYAVIRAIAVNGEGVPRRAAIAWVLAGAVMGIAGLLKETGFILAVAVLIWLPFARVFHWTTMSRAAPAWIALGIVLSLTPLLVRNGMVGAPLFAVSSVAPITFALANAPDAPASGAVFNGSAGARVILERSEGRLLATLLETWRLYEGGSAQLMTRLAARLSAVWSDIELPDNYSYDYTKRHAPLLALLPRFACIWLLALAGLALLLHDVLLRPRRSGNGRGNSGDHDHRGASISPTAWSSLILCILAAHVAAQSFAPVMSRYRLVIVPFLLLLAGYGLAGAVAAARAGRWRVPGGWAGTLAAVLLIWTAWPVHPRQELEAIRPADFSAGARSLAAHGHLEQAWQEWQAGIEYCRRFEAVVPAASRYWEANLRKERLMLFLGRGRVTEVAEDWTRLQTMLAPGDPFLPQAGRMVEQMTRDLGGNP